VKSIDDVLSSIYERDYAAIPVVKEDRPAFRTQAELDAHVGALEKEMKAAAANLDFEKAAALRDRVRALKTRELGLGGPGGRGVSPAAQ
jgi:excinuclease ABC subunit B